MQAGQTHFAAARSILADLNATRASAESSQRRLAKLVLKLNPDTVDDDAILMDFARVMAEHFRRIAESGDRNTLVAGLAEAQCALTELQARIEGAAT